MLLCWALLTGHGYVHVDFNVDKLYSVNECNKERESNPMDHFTEYYFYS